MCHSLLLRTGLMAILALVPRASHAQSDVRGELVVRTYDPNHLVRDRLAGARQVAEDILRQAGISVRWQHCGGTAPEDDTMNPACHSAIGANDMVARLVEAPANANRNTLGFSYIDGNDNR